MSNVLPSKSKASPADFLHPQASPATIELPPLTSPKDRKFLSYDARTAGRAVLIELYAPAKASREVREALWHGCDAEVVITLGMAAQTLEQAGINWRQADNHNVILTQSRLLNTSEIH
ncbi:hypothetical protein HY733_01215 [Candidatus Uhrbacteria bacterium]|nr:hypothetical protein [Candidatus Uhrbacteria bacterium]